jgi:hypothetical protein
MMDITEKHGHLVYRYTAHMVGMSFDFSLFCEVGAIYQDAAREVLMQKYGVTPDQLEQRDTDSPYRYADFLPDKIT